MKKRKIKHDIVFSMYPNANGFGFVYMDGPRKLIDYGVVRINPISNAKILNRLKKSFEYFKPDIVLVKNPEGKYARTGKRIEKLVDRIFKYGKTEKLNVEQLSRDQIRNVFDQFGAKTKFEISQVLVSEFEELKPRTPYKRKLWTSEDRNMAIFDAISLAVCWYFYNE